LAARLLYVRTDEVAQSGHAVKGYRPESFTVWPGFFCELQSGGTSDCKRLGFDPPARTLHSFRHSFALNYLRRGGSVFHLQKVLGHSTLEMTRRYANLVTADLQAVHQRVSLLSHLT
jgi:integrase